MALKAMSKPELDPNMFMFVFQSEWWDNPLVDVFFFLFVFF